MLERVIFLERLNGLLDCVQSYCTGLDHFLSLMLKLGGLAGGGDCPSSGGVANATDLRCSAVIDRVRGSGADDATAASFNRLVFESALELCSSLMCASQLTLFPRILLHKALSKSLEIFFL